MQRLEIIGQLRYRFRQRSRSDFDNNRNRRGVLCALNNPAYTYPITSVCQTVFFFIKNDDFLIFQISLEHLDTCRKGLRFLYSCTTRPYTWCIHPYHPEDRKLSEDDGQLTRPL